MSRTEGWAGGELELKVAILLRESNFSLKPPSRNRVHASSRNPPRIYEFPHAGEKTSGRDYNGKVRRRRLVLPGFAVIPSLARDRNRDGKLWRGGTNPVTILSNDFYPLHPFHVSINANLLAQRAITVFPVSCDRGSVARTSSRKTRKNEWVAWNGNNFFETRNKKWNSVEEVISEIGKQKCLRTLMRTMIVIQVAISFAYCVQPCFVR